MIVKNFKITFTKPTFILGHILGVAFVFLMCMGFDSIVRWKNSLDEVLLPFVKDTNYLQPCIGKGCISFAYGIIGSTEADWIRSTVSYVAEKSKFEFGKDIQMVYKDPHLGNFFDSGIVNTQVTVLFCSDYVEFPFPI